MVKSGGKNKTKAKGKEKVKDKKGKEDKKPEEIPVAVPVEEKEEIAEKKEEAKEEVHAKLIEEPCIFNCAQDKVTYRPNSYPGHLPRAKTMAVMGSENGSYDSLCKLLHSAFRSADRVYVMVPWGNYVVFRAPSDKNMTYFVFDGCTCNVNRFRYLDLTCGTAGLLYFEEMHKLINYIIMSRSRREEIKNLKRCAVDDVCKELYGSDHI